VADYDTKVLYLENPPASAPPANYLIGVRMRNLGLFPAATSGYVQVFSLDTGLLVATFPVASAEIDPGQEKQAFATLYLDLSAALPGERFLFSGAITSPGDTVPSNDILNPTTITIVDAPPPPPPPVASHHAQHEDGGADELSLDGLHGVLGTPQPYADHAAKHQLAGDDQLSVVGLPGQLIDPQIAADHGNERHVVPFLYSSELDNHMDDETPHGNDTTFERLMNKDQGEGYAGLDAGALVPAVLLGAGPGGTKFLRGDQTWQSVAGLGLGDIDDTALLWLPDDGTDSTASRSDHRHDKPDGLGQMFWRIVPYHSGSFLLHQFLVPSVATRVQRQLRLKAVLWGQINGAVPRLLQIDAAFGPAIGPAVVLGSPAQMTLATAAGAPWSAEVEVALRSLAPNYLGGVVHLDVGQAVQGPSGVNPGFTMQRTSATVNNQVFDKNVDNYLFITLTVTGDLVNSVTNDVGDCFVSFTQ